MEWLKDVQELSNIDVYGTFTEAQDSQQVWEHQWTSKGFIPRITKMRTRTIGHKTHLDGHP